MKTITKESIEADRLKENAVALTLHARLSVLQISSVPLMSRDRHISRKLQAKLARQLFRDLDQRGISVTAPNYSMAQSVDVRQPQRSDYVKDAGGRVEYEKDPAAIANHAAREKIREILNAAFPNHDDRSDTQSDHFDYCWSIR